ncbi:MAG: hypothetical protein JXR80_02660 [Deltaproteobacteria bacterium]|nr:hypothetical protein [Deltaproteobacteria bacterium]
MTIQKQTQKKLIYGFILLAWVGMIAQNFWATGMVTMDQIEFSLDGLKNDFFSKVLEYATTQGRVYFLLTKIIDLKLAAYPDCFLTRIAIISSFLLGPLCFAYAVFNTLTARLLFLWIYLNLASVGFSHMPPAAYPVVTSFPFIFWALGAKTVRMVNDETANPSPYIIITLFVLGFLSFFQYEPITAFSFCGFLWFISTSPLQTRIKIILGSTVLGALLLYATVYLTWRHINPSSYAGLKPGDLSLLTIFKTTLAYTLGGLPLFLENPPLLWGDALVGKTTFHFPEISGTSLLSMASISTVLIFCLCAFCLIKLIFIHEDKTKNSFLNKRGWIYLIGAFFFFLSLIVSANGLIAVSDKYQHLANNQAASYLTSRLALMPISFILVVMLKHLSKLIPRKFNHTLIAIVVIFFGVVGIWVYTGNALIAPRLKANLARWQAVTILAQCRPSELETRALVANELYFSVYSNIPDIKGYWQDYTRLRFGKQLELLASKNADKVLPRVQLYHSEDGELKAVTVQSNTFFEIYNKRTSPPAIFFVENSEGQATSCLKSQTCPLFDFQRSLYDISNLSSEFKKSLIQLSWIVPETAVLPQNKFTNLLVPDNQITEAVQDIYLLYFKRNADEGGLNFYRSKTLEARGSLFRIINDFESIKGKSSPERDLEAVLSTLKTSSEITEQYTKFLKIAEALKPFGRRWVLYTKCKSSLFEIKKN